MPVVAASVAIPAVAVAKFQSIPEAVLSGMSESTAFAAMPTMVLAVLFAAAGAWQASRMAT